MTMEKRIKKTLFLLLFSLIGPNNCKDKKKKEKRKALVSTKFLGKKTLKNQGLRRDWGKSRETSEENHRGGRGGHYSWHQGGIKGRIRKFLLVAIRRLE